MIHSLNPCQTVYYSKIGTLDCNVPWLVAKWLLLIEREDAECCKILGSKGGWTGAPESAIIGGNKLSRRHWVNELPLAKIAIMVPSFAVIHSLASCQTAYYSKMAPLHAMHRDWPQNGFHWWGGRRRMLQSLREERRRNSRSRVCHYRRKRILQQSLSQWTPADENCDKSVPVQRESVFSEELLWFTVGLVTGAICE